MMSYRHMLWRAGAFLRKKKKAKEREEAEKALPRYHIILIFSVIFLISSSFRGVDSGLLNIWPMLLSTEH